MTKTDIINNYLKILDLQNINTLQDITKLIQAHEATFAFSSMKVLLEDNISLELEDIYNSLVLNKKGGYCFEHNKLIYEVLKELGFDVKFYLARVVNNFEGNEPQTHRFTILNYENKRYLIDVGIGFRSPTEPILFSEEVTTTNLEVNFWVKEFEDSLFGLMSEVSGQPFRITKFDLKYCNEGDFEMGHFYSHKHPCAVFVNNLVISIIKEKETLSLRNNTYLKISSTSIEKITIKSLEEFIQIIKNDFNCSFDFEQCKKVYDKYIDICI